MVQSPRKLALIIVLQLLSLAVPSRPSMLTAAATLHEMETTDNTTEGGPEEDKSDTNPTVNPHQCAKVTTFMAAATKAKEKFDEVVKKVAAGAEGGAKGQPMCAPLKGKVRMCEKMELYHEAKPIDWLAEYLSPEPDEEKPEKEPCKYHPQLTDAVRCMIVYADASALRDGIKAAVDILKVNNAKFVKVKNRINVLGDFLTNIGIGDWNKDTKGAKTCDNYHVGEVQFHMIQVVAAKEGGGKFDSKNKELLNLFPENKQHELLKQLVGKASEALKIDAYVSGKGPDVKLGEEMMSFFKSGHHMYEASRSGPVFEQNATLADNITAKSNRVYQQMIKFAGCDSEADPNPCEQMKAYTPGTFGIEEANYCIGGPPDC